MSQLEERSLTGDQSVTIDTEIHEKMSRTEIINSNIVK